jgi:hypothetical protein
VKVDKHVHAMAARSRNRVLLKHSLRARPRLVCDNTCEGCFSYLSGYRSVEASLLLSRRPYQEGSDLIPPLLASISAGICAGEIDCCYRGSL